MYGDGGYKNELKINLGQSFKTVVFLMVLNLRA